jgi:hypothetical protein
MDAFRSLAQDFVGGIANFDVRCIEGIAIRIDPLVGTERCRFPNLKPGFRADVACGRQLTCSLLLQCGDAREKHNRDTLFSFGGVVLAALRALGGSPDRGSDSAPQQHPPQERS